MFSAHDEDINACAIEQLEQLTWKTFSAEQAGHFSYNHT